jgi:diguanylate cyclase (GGDEF)-like protein/PAS domain S-box-containing protein
MPESPADAAPAPPALPERPVVVRWMFVLAACVFMTDVLVPLEIAISVLYVLPVLLSLWLSDQRITRLSAGLCTAAVVAGEFLDEGSIWHGAVNRSIAIFAIWATEALGRLRMAVETELRRSRETTATTLASIAEGVITTDAEGRVSFVNRVAEDLLGWRSREVLGQPLWELLPGRAGGSDAPAADLLPSTGELRVRRPNGAELVLEVSAAAIPDPARPGDAGFGRVLVFRDVTERRAREAAVEALAYRDPLTGLANRASFEDRLQLELARAERAHKKLALVFLDLDGFKRINDAHGHAIGDELLRSVAKRLREALRAEDTVARLGGDEFTVLLPGLAAASDAELVLEKLMAVLAPSYAVEGLTIPAPPSLGLAVYPDDVERAPGRRAVEAARLLSAADAAMYAAKTAGGARWWRPRVVAGPGAGG